jgi:hypothetical protein
MGSEPDGDADLDADRDTDRGSHRVVGWGSNPIPSLAEPQATAASTVRMAGSSDRMTARIRPKSSRRSRIRVDPNHQSTDDVLEKPLGTPLAMSA